MSMVLNVVAYHRGPKHLLLATFIQWRRVYLELSAAAAADLAGLELSEWYALEHGWIPEERSTIQAIAGTLEVPWPELIMLAGITRHNQPAVA